MKPEELVAKVFGLEADDLTDESGPETVEEWDSLGHVNLVMELEEIYGVALSTDDALAISDLGSLKRILTERGASW